MDGRRLGHIFFLGRLQKTRQSFSGGILVMMAAVASVGLLVQATRLEGPLGVHESESMTMCVPSLANGRHPRHVTADAAAKGVNPVDRAVLNRGVTAFAQPILKQPGLGTNGEEEVGRVYACSNTGLALVDAVAGGADHTNLGMFALLPIKILLIAIS